MGRSSWVAAALFAASFPGLMPAQEPGAREILDKAAQTYQNLSSCRFEWTTVSETKTGSTISTRETRYQVAARMPDKVRVVIDYAHAGDWFRISDGKTFVQYRSSDRDRTRTPASPQDVNAVGSTTIGSYRHLNENVRSAKLAGSERVELGDRDVDCYVVEVQYPPGTLLPGTRRMPTRFWIDKVRFLVLREVAATSSGEGSNATENRRTTTFTAADVNTAVPESLFMVGQLRHD